MAPDGPIYFCNNFFPETIGGAQTTTRAWTEAFQQLGNHVVWYGPPSENKIVPKPNGVEIRAMPKVSRIAHPDAIRKLSVDIASEKPQAVIFNGAFDYHLSIAYPLIALGQTDGMAFVFHNDQFRHSASTANPLHRINLKDNFRPYYNLILRQFVRIALSQPGVKTIAVSESIADNLQNQHISPTRPLVCNPVSNHDNTDCHPQVKEPTNRLNITTVCRISPEKGLLNKYIPVAKAAAAVALPADFTIVGPETSDHAFYQAVQKEASGVVHLAGEKQGKALCTVYNRSHLFCLFSDTEGFGLVVPEAMAHALPIIATDLPPIKSFTQSESPVGQLVDSRHPEAAVNQALRFIIKLIQFPDLLPVLSAASFGLSNKYSPKQLSTRFTSLILS